MEMASAPTEIKRVWISKIGALGIVIILLGGIFFILKKKTEPSLEEMADLQVEELVSTEQWIAAMSVYLADKVSQEPTTLLNHGWVITINDLGQPSPTVAGVLLRKFTLKEATPDLGKTLFEAIPNADNLKSLKCKATIRSGEFLKNLSLIHI